jgi:hypothetical protein
MIRLTLPHHYDFGADADVVGENLLRPDAWDRLRLRTNGPFSIAADRAELERQADERPELEARMRAVDAVLRERGAGSVASYGVGGGVAELWLLRIAPNRRLLLTDYAPETVKRLGHLLPEADVSRYDLIREPPLDADVHLFHRIDTELDNRQWRDVCSRFSGTTLVVIAGEVLPVSEIPRQLMAAIRNRGATAAGWTRTIPALESLWRGTHRGEQRVFGDLDGWVLDPR